MGSVSAKKHPSYFNLLLKDYCHLVIFCKLVLSLWFSFSNAKYNYMRLYTPFIFIILFVVWFSYRFFIKKDLKNNMNNLFAGLFFIGTWITIYYTLLI